MTILVTGGAGFIGSHVVKALLARGEEVMIIDDMNSYYDPQLKKARLAQFQQEIVFYQVPVWDLEQMRKVFQAHRFSKICHLAAQAGVRYSLQDPFAYNRTNVQGMLVILELMKEFGIKDLVYASSSSVYGGNKKMPFAAEDRVDQPLSLYAATKRANELYAYVYHHLYGFNCYGLRFFTVYGPWGRPDMSLFKFTKAILEGNEIDVYNQGKMKRSFTYVQDIVDGVLKALDQVKGYDLFNLGNPTAVELLEYISLIEKAVGKKAKKRLLPMQQGDVPDTIADITHTTEVLGWVPKVSLEQGVHEFVGWYKKYYGDRA